MIRNEDFEIEIGQSKLGVLVRVKHKPTGAQRIADPVDPKNVGATRDRFIRELRAMVVCDDDVRVDFGHAEGGDFIRVAHLPSGISRCALRSEGSSEDDLLDEVLEELFAREQNQ